VKNPPPSARPLRLDSLIQHLGLVHGELLKPRHWSPELADPLREVVAVQVGGGVADASEEVLGDVDPAVVDVRAVLPVQLLLEGFRKRGRLYLTRVDVPPLIYISDTYSSDLYLTVSLVSNSVK
jgi:hypothetical protein